MVKQYLEKIRDEYQLQKESLEEEITKYEIQKKENTKFIQLLESSSDKSVEGFYPREINSYQAGKIAELQEEQKTISEKLSSLRDQLQEYEFRIVDITSVIKDVDVDIQSVISGSDLYETRLALLRSVETERQRIARELHDSTAQNLTALVHKAELCSKIVESDPVKCRLELYAMGQALRGIIENTRELIFDLRPMSFDDIGFDVTIERALDQFEKKYNLICKLQIEGEPYTIDSVFQLTLYRVIQESCNNAAKHANATKITVTITYLENSVIVTVKDNGQGFDVSNAESAQDDNSGFGLSMMRERVYLMSGTMQIDSKIGEGTSVTVSIPCKKGDV